MRFQNEGDDLMVRALRTITLRWTIAPFLLLLLGCTKSAPPASDEKKVVSDFKIGLVLDKGGRDDKSFNTAAYKGASLAAKDLNADLKYIESPNDSSFEPSLRALSEKNYDLIIAVGFSQKDALQKVAAQFPKIKYAIVDAPVEGANIQSLMFAEQEGSYLVGYLAGLVTKTGVIGFVGGMEIPMIKRFEMGYEAGAKAARSDIKVLVNFIGNTNDAWVNPARAKELSLAQFGNKADIVFAPAGASAMGAFDAAEEKKLLAIGVDSNQNWVKPGRILTSMLKRVDEAVYRVIKDTKAGQFKNGVQSFSLKDKGVDYAVDEHNEKLIAPFKEKLEKVRADIISGKIKVPDYYETRKK